MLAEGNMASAVNQTSLLQKSQRDLFHFMVMENKKIQMFIAMRCLVLMNH